MHTNNTNKKYMRFFRKIDLLQACIILYIGSLLFSLYAFRLIVNSNLCSSLSLTNVIIGCASEFYKTSIELHVTYYYICFLKKTGMVLPTHATLNIIQTIFFFEAFEHMQMNDIAYSHFFLGAFFFNQRNIAIIAQILNKLHTRVTQYKQ